MFCRNRKINIHVQKSLQINDEVGVKLNKSYWTFVWEVRGYENLLFMERDVGNFVGQQRCALGKNGDGKTLLSYFARMREWNKDFYYDIDLDNDFYVKNVF